MATPAEREELRALLKSKSVRTGDFTLASGKKSDLYVDCRVTTLDPRGAVLVGQQMHKLVRDEEARRGVKVDALGGLTMGADPISLSTAMTSSMAGDATPIRCFVVRKEAKGHGTRKQIEGLAEEGPLDVVIVDDVCTSGDSTIKAILAAREANLNVLGAICLVDREEGARESIEGVHNCLFDRIFTLAEL